MLNFVDCLPQAFGHAVKAVNGFFNKLSRHNFSKILFRRNIVLVNLESLFQKTSFQFDQVAVIPLKDSDLQFRMCNFSYYAHAAK